MARPPVDQNLTPEGRLNCLISYSSSVAIDPQVSAKLYYRSGLSMFKQFNIFYKECDWENAFCLYLKYELLFFDKIKKHPEYNEIPVNIKSVNATNFRLMKPKAEHAKRELFKQYKREYMSYCDELKTYREKELTENSNVQRRKGSGTDRSTQLRVSKKSPGRLSSSEGLPGREPSELLRSRSSRLKTNTAIEKEPRLDRPEEVTKSRSVTTKTISERSNASHKTPSPPSQEDDFQTELHKSKTNQSLQADIRSNEKKRI